MASDEVLNTHGRYGYGGTFNHITVITTARSRQVISAQARAISFSLRAYA